MAERVHHVLFLSRPNSARSILAEAVLNRDAKGKFVAHSAAVDPAAAIDPNAAELVESVGLPVSQVRPKHYSEFAKAGAPPLDFAFTMSDTAAGEPLPTWPGQPVTAHWSSPDPVRADGEAWEKKLAFGRVLAELERRIEIFINLPFPSLDRISLKSRLDEIGRSRANG